LGLKTEETLQGTFTLTEKKTGLKRKIRLPRGILEDLSRVAGPTYLFESNYKPGQPISRQAAWKRFKLAAKQAGIDGQTIIGTHSMRKSYACNAFLKDLNLGKLRAKMGHEYESTSLGYITQLLGFVRNGFKQYETSPTD